VSCITLAVHLEPWKVLMTQGMVTSKMFIGVLGLWSAATMVAL